MDNSDKMKVENQILNGQNQAATQAVNQAASQNAASTSQINTAKTAPQANAPGIQFATSNIDPNKQEFFTNVKETTDKKIGKALKDYQNYRNKPENQFHPFEEKHKKTTISIIASVVLITTATLITLAVTVWNKQPTDEKSKLASVEDGATADEVNESARHLLYEEEDGYDKSNEYYEKQISLEKDENKKFELQRDYALQIAKNGDPYYAVEYFNSSVNIDALTKDNRYSCYAVLSYLYKLAGDTESADAVKEMIVKEGLDKVGDDEE